MSLQSAGGALSQVVGAVFGAGTKIMKVVSLRRFAYNIGDLLVSVTAPKTDMIY